MSQPTHRGRSRHIAVSLLLLTGIGLCWGGCSRQHEDGAFLPSSPEFSTALQLFLSAGSIPADGFSRVQVTARITGGADLDRRTVRFTTDNGDFPRDETATTKAKMTEIEVSSAGSATVDLRSGTSPTLATITAEVLAGGEPIPDLVTRKTVEFTPAEAGAILQLSASSLIGEADGSTVIFIYADVSEDLPLGDKVAFVTTLGKFLNGEMDGDTKTEVPLDIGRRATAALESPDAAGEALVTATVAETTQEIRILYDPALPEVIVVNLGQTKLERGGTEASTIMLKLSRSEGEVSDGLAVDYSAFEKAYGEPLDLLFSMEELTMDQEATAQVSLGMVEFVGTATIRAAIGDVRGEADIEIVGSTEVPDIAVDPPSLNFGSVTVNDMSDRGINLRNVGEDDLVVMAIDAAGGEFSVIDKPPLNTVIAPGGSVVVTVRFSPTAAGDQSGTLTINSNDPDESPLVVSLSGEGT